MVGENYQPRSESIPLIAAQICAGSCGRINKSASGYFIEGLIEKWAKHANCWIDDIEKYALSKSWERAKELDGTESMLYTTPYNTIVKVWGMNNYYFNPQLAVEKITLHNFLFGSDTYLNVIGFTKINYFLYFILEQPIIHFTKESFNSIAIQDYLQKKYPNCNVDKFKGQFIVHLPDIYIWDLHGRNVVRTSKNRDFVVIDCNIKFKNDDNIKDLNSDLSGTSTPTKITDKGDDFSYFDYPKDVIDKFYTYITLSKLDKYIPAYSNYFFDDDGHLCFPTRRTQDIIDCVDIDRCLKEYEDLKHEWIAKAEDNINGFIWQFFINDTEFSPRGSYNYKILNRDLVELLLGYAKKFEETSELYPDKLGVENLQDYNKTKEILTKRLAELDKQEKKPKQPKQPPTIPMVQPERLLTFDINRLYMSCVHCVRGYKFYSDRRFLLKLKSDYPESYEGKNVMPKHFFKQFEKFILNPEKVLFYDEGAYPVADAVIYSTLAKIKYSVPIDIQSLYQYLCDLIDYYEKQTGEEIKVKNSLSVPFFYHGQHAFTMDVAGLKKWLSAAKLIQADTIKWVDYSYAVVLQNSKSDNGEILLIMPHYRDDVPTITDGKCLIDVDWDIWYKPYDLANTRKANILITEAKLCTLRKTAEKRTPPPSMSEIVAMLDSHEFSGEPYTEADKEKLSQYQGIGGKGKEVGAQSGILNQYYTPVWVCECMYKLAKKYGFKGGSILEPSAATGNMIKPFYDRGDYNHIDAFEIDKLTAKICKILYPEVEVMNQYFETAFLEYPRFTSKARKPWLKNYPYDLVIGNPPYGVHKNLYSGYFTGKDHFQQIEMFFIYKALQLLKTGGLLIYITSINFMSTGLKTYAAAKKQIGEIAEFVDAYRLPSVFDNTPICTDIIVLRKK